MAQIAPKVKNFLRGICYPTCAHYQKQIYLLPAKLGPAGEQVRQAKKAFLQVNKNQEKIKDLNEKEQLEEKEQQELERLERETTEEKVQHLLLLYIVEILRQQYTLNAKKDEIEDTEIEELWQETVAELLTEQDLMLIFYSVDAGKLITQEELIEIVKESEEKK